MPERDIWEERREFLEEEGGDFAGGALLGLIFSAFIYFVNSILEGRIAAEGIEVIGITAISVLSWLSRIFFASIIFIVSYTASGILASIVYYHYVGSYILLYSFLFGSIFGYLLSSLEVSVFPRKKKSAEEKVAPSSNS
jgi:hypothetical protein